MTNLNFYSKIPVFLISVVSVNCTSEKTNEINYLGQKPPGMIAEVFAPGIISTDMYEHSSPAFSPDGSVVLWTSLDTNFRARMLEMKYENGVWSKPAIASFADTTADDYYPSFSPDGKKLYFSSRRKMPPGFPETGDMRIWEVERNEKGWGIAIPVDTIASQGHEYAHSVTGNGTLYFSSRSAGGTDFDIMKSERKDNRNTSPELLPYNINSVSYEDGAYIAPDESFLIFESGRPEAYLSLYIAFKQDDGSWGTVVNMGSKINSGKGERFARLSPDGKYLFFGSFRDASPGRRGADIYWIDAKVIDEIKNSEAAKIKIRQPLGNDLIQALSKNNTDTSAYLLKQWLDVYPNSLDATITYSSMLRKQKRYTDAEQLLLNNGSKWSDNESIIMEKGLLKLVANQDDEAERLLAPILTEGDRQRERLLYLAGALFDIQKFDQSDKYFDKAMVINPHPVFLYNRACGYTHIGEKSRAFKLLNKAAELGYNERKNYETDPDLAPLQSDARWEALMKKLK